MDLTIFFHTYFSGVVGPYLELATGPTLYGSLDKKADSTLHETDSKLAPENFNGFEDEVKPFRSRILFSGANLLLVSGSVHSLDIFVEI